MELVNISDIRDKGERGEEGGIPYIEALETGEELGPREKAGQCRKPRPEEVKECQGLGGRRLRHRYSPKLLQQRKWGSIMANGLECNWAKLACQEKCYRIVNNDANWIVRRPEYCMYAEVLDDSIMQKVACLPMGDLPKAEKCGCRDSACTQSYWQIQSLKR
jgi:hypothetical protein